MAYLLLRYLRIIIIRSVRSRKMENANNQQSGGERERVARAGGGGGGGIGRISFERWFARPTNDAHLLDLFRLLLRDAHTSEADEKSPEQNGRKQLPLRSFIVCLFSGYVDHVQFEDINMYRGSQRHETNPFGRFDGFEQRRISVECNGKILKSNICIIWPHSSATFQIENCHWSLN